MEILTSLRTTSQNANLLMRNIMAALVLSAALFFIPRIAMANEFLEQQVKAAFLYKFSIYVEWPASAFATPASPINLCVSGTDPFGPMLERVIGTEKVNGRSIVVQRLKTIEPVHSCHILYIGASDTQSAAEAIETVRGSYVLTVTDNARFNTDAGIINFMIANNRVRFDINDETAAQNGLVISSKLMSLALNVKRRPATQGIRK
jgi:hypothetical protein